MPIVSASRRTDIPAFYTDWLINRIHEEYVLYPLPWSDKLKYLELTPENVDCFVFWSKNYAKLIPYLNLLDTKGFNYLFHFTINNYPKQMEEHVISTDEAITQLKRLCNSSSPDHVHWRYDPIIPTNDYNSNFHLYNFEKIASQLEGYTKRCYFEFIDMYKKVETNFDKRKISLKPLSQDQKINLTKSMATIANKYGINLYSCCDDYLVIDNVLKARCIDAELIYKLTGKVIDVKHSPTRKECGCNKSIDIGEYGSCLHGCLYCYANDNFNNAQTFYNNHDTYSPALNKSKLTKFENQNLAKSTQIDDEQLKLF